MADTTAPTELHEVCPGVFRLSTWDVAAGITFNQFLLHDDKPTLIETGDNRMFAAVRSRLAEVLDPASLCYIVVPHCHDWGSLVVYEETAKLLFSSDLFIQTGRGEPVIEADLSQNMLAMYRQYTPIAPGKFLLQAADKIAALELEMLLPMHGAAIRKNCAPYLQALREYALEG